MRLSTSSVDAERRLIGGRVGRVSIVQLVDGSHVIAWDGETKLGQMKPKAWADDFVLTYKVAGYTPDPKTSCQ